MYELDSFLYGLSIIKIIFNYVLPMLFLILLIINVFYLKKMYEYTKYIARTTNKFVQKYENKEE